MAHDQNMGNRLTAALADRYSIEAEIDSGGMATVYRARDVKPANILLERGHALLADFGIAQAKAGAEETKLTGSGMSLGTPSYMSPEQIAGNREVDGRSDQYALGCVLFEMLAGHPPFTGANVQGVMRQHLAVDAARVIADRLAARKIPYDRGRTTYVRACISSLFGEEDQAVLLLRLAYQEGWADSVDLHTEMDLEPLQGYPPFEEFLTPGS